MKKKYLLVIIPLTVFLSICFYYLVFSKPTLSTSNEKDRWNDSVFKSLMPDERIAQLFFVAAYSNKEQFHTNKISDLIKNYKIGGVIFFQGGLVRQANLTNYFQSVSKTPLLVAMDAERGIGMRLDSAIEFPRQMMLGAIQNEYLIYLMGKEIAQQCKRMGVHINFAPVVDVNSNPKNPVINSRSFGENSYNVAVKSLAYMRGLQDNNIMAVAKHFPGHGNTDVDSHIGLPVLKHNINNLDTSDLAPFKRLINKGIAGIMVGHLSMPTVANNSANLTASISKEVVTNLLRNKLKFNGIVFTDAMDMKSISNYNENGVADVKALLAGDDIIVMSMDIPLAIESVKMAIKKGFITQNEIDERCKKVIALKHWAGLNVRKKIQTQNINKDINSVSAELIKRRLVENALTLVKNDDNIIPLRKLDSTEIASISIGSDTLQVFQQTLSLYTNVKHFNVSRYTPIAKLNKYIDSVAKYSLVIVGIHRTGERPQDNYGITPQTIDFVEKLASKKNVILDLFGNPYSLEQFKGLDKIKAILISYQDFDDSQDLSAQLIFGGIASKGRLPVSVKNNFVAGTGIFTKKIRLKYSIPEDVNMNSEVLAKIETLIKASIDSGIFPGCQILAAKDSVVFYSKSFGYYTYGKDIAVNNSVIYDLASVTKIAATTPSVMKLYEQNKLNVDRKLSDYIPALRTSNKSELIVKDVMAHYTNLQLWWPFYQNALKKGKFKPEIVSQKMTWKYPVPVTDSLFIIKTYKDSIFNYIYKSPIRDDVKFRYSDFGFYMMQKAVENIIKEPINKYVERTFYKPLGATTLGYLPIERFAKNRMAPTEIDKYFRKQKIQGYVQDPGAAMLGGVSGHAGVFSDANDLAKLMQMYLQHGNYGDIQFFDTATIKLFTSCVHCDKDDRRGIGFDRPLIHYVEKEASTCGSVSQKSFGHTGFTGTMVWADPENNLVYIFLSNRTYPDVNNNKLSQKNIRAKVQQIFYDAQK